MRFRNLNQGHAPCIPQSPNLFLLPKGILPAFLFFTGFAEEGGESAEIEQALVQPVEGLIERAGEIHEEDDAVAFGVVPDFMIKRVVEDEGFAFAPGIEVVADADADAFAGFGDHEAEVEAQDAVPGAAMGGDVFAGGQDAEKGGGHAGDLAEEADGFGAAFAIFRAVHADAGEEEGFPVVVRLDGADFFQDVLKAGHLVAKGHDGVEFGADEPPFVLDLFGPGEEAGVVDVRVAMGRDAGDAPFGGGLGGDAETVEEGAIGV